jgi:hypothetical protein
LLGLLVLVAASGARAEGDEVPQPRARWRRQGVEVAVDIDAAVSGT